MDNLELFSDLDTMIESLNESPIGCLFLKEPNDWVKAICVANQFAERKLVTYKDKCGVYGNNQHVSVHLFELHYTDGENNAEVKDLVPSRACCVKEIYYRWCAVKGYKPNPNEGWFKSKRFKAFLDEHDYLRMNFVIMLA